MQNKKIKMVAVDFDATLIDSGPDGTYIDHDTMELFEKLIKEGVHVGIVTGRPRNDIRDVLKSLGIDWTGTFPSYYIERENYIYKKEGDTFKVDEEWKNIIYSKTSTFAKKLTKHMSGLLDELDAHDLTPRRHTLLSNFGWELYYDSTESAIAAADLMTLKYSHVQNCQIYRNRMMVCIIAEGCGKGVSLKYLGESLGINPSEIIAFGDSLNDLSMLDGRYGISSGGMVNCEEGVKDKILKNGGIVSKYRASKGIYDVLTSILNIEKK